MNEKLYELLLKLPKKNLVNLLWGSLVRDHIMSAHGMNSKDAGYNIITRRE